MSEIVEGLGRVAPRSRRTPLDRNQSTGFWTAWAAWLLDGMNSVIDALVTVPALTEVLPRSGIAAPPGDVGSIVVALFPAGWGSSFA